VYRGQDLPVFHGTCRMSESRLNKALSLLREVVHEKTLPDYPPELADEETVQELYAELADIRQFVYEIANGNLSPRLETKGYMAGALKMLRSNLSHLTWQTKMIASGDFTQRVDFMGDFAASFNSMVEQLEAANEELTLLASQDSLTQVANRRVFDNHLSREWERAARNKTTIAMILCDNDYFKQYNDTYGHQAGDACLRKVAGVMKGAVRRPVDLVVRYGGEEFALVLPETDADGAGHLAQSILEAVRNLKIPHSSSKAASYITVSCGVSSALPGKQSPGILIGTADEALYEAKAKGRNMVVVQECVPSD